jgi:hypothetical protein
MIRLLEEVIRTRLLMEIIKPLSMMTTPKVVNLTDVEIDLIKKVDYKNIVLTPMNSESPVKIKVDVPGVENISNGIDLYILLTESELYQIDINMVEELRGMGLGYKIYLSFITQFGHIYSGNGRRQNDREVVSIWNKLKSESGLEVYENDKGKICIVSGMENNEYLLNKFK